MKNQNHILFPIAEPYSFLVSNTALPSDNPSRFRKNILKTSNVNNGN